jgi:hypothetical protein
MHPDRPDDPDSMLVGYDEGLLSSDGETLIQRKMDCVRGSEPLRFAVYLHLYDPLRPLQWPYGQVTDDAYAIQRLQLVGEKSQFHQQSCYNSMGVFDSANCDVASGLEIVILLEKPITFTQLPMDQEVAKGYLSTVGRAGQARQIRLGFHLQILDEKPKVSPHPTNPNLRQVFLKARVIQIVALAIRPNVQSNQIGVVYPTNQVPK